MKMPKRGAKKNQPKETATVHQFEPLGDPPPPPASPPPEPVVRMRGPIQQWAVDERLRLDAWVDGRGVGPEGADTMPLAFDEAMRTYSLIQQHCQHKILELLIAQVMKKADAPR
jgi:hypothetical protein